MNISRAIGTGAMVIAIITILANIFGYREGLETGLKSGHEKGLSEGFEWGAYLTRDEDIRWVRYAKERCGDSTKPKWLSLCATDKDKEEECVHFQVACRDGVL